MAESGKRRPTVLIIDDDEQIRSLLCSILDEEYDCVTTSSAEDALSVLKTIRFELVISDINMNGISGLELVPHIIRETPETVVVMVSGRHHIDAAIQAMVQAHPQVWVDETSWREQEQRGWLWVAVSPTATCFRIDPSRGQQALWQLLGADYSGVVHSDRSSAYHVLPDRLRHLCWAHVSRHLHGLVDQPHADSIRAPQLLQWPSKTLLPCLL